MASTVSTPKPRLWKCPRCGRSFANRNQWHSCVRISVESHLEVATPSAVALFRAFERCVRACDPLRLAPVKTRIGFQVRMTFAAVTLRRHWIVGHPVLDESGAGERIGFDDALDQGRPASAGLPGPGRGRAVDLDGAGSFAGGLGPPARGRRGGR